MNSGINAKYATHLAFQTFFVKKILKYFFEIHNYLYLS